MKNFYKSALLALILITGLFLSTLSPAQEDISENLEMTTYRLTVYGMTCPFCVYGVEKNIKKIDGVLQVHTDLKEGWIYVHTHKKTKFTEDMARKVVESAGFTLKKFEIFDERPHP